MRNAATSTRQPSSVPRAISIVKFLMPAALSGNSNGCQIMKGICVPRTYLEEEEIIGVVVRLFHPPCTVGEGNGDPGV